MSEIIPAVLAKTEEELLEKVGALPPVSILHLDVLEKDVWSSISRDFEAHLMVEDPVAIAGRWTERGAKRIIAHKPIPKIDGVEIGLGIELDVPIERVDGVDFIQLMSIAEIGKQGHPFDPRIFDKIKEAKRVFPGLPISVDGGINVSNFRSLLDAGADRLVVGSSFQELWNLQKKS